MPTVLFEKVGRDQRTFAAEIRQLEDGQLDGDQMVRAIKQHGALASRDIGFEDGYILVGGFRPVGSYRLAHQSQ